MPHCLGKDLLTESAVLLHVRDKCRKLVSLGYDGEYFPGKVLEEGKEADFLGISVNV